MLSPDHLGPLIEILESARSIVVLTGSGISAESGIPTFRGEDGLWKQYRAEQLATPAAFERDPSLVWEWYDWRRQIIGSKAPNAGHLTLAGWETLFPRFRLITQNVDGLHQRAGSRDVLELHGNIWKLRCTRENTVTENLDFPLEPLPPSCPDCGAPLRPHVVWFGESLDQGILSQAFRSSSDCDVMFVVGTSAVVQPAASLPFAAAGVNAAIIEINLEPTPLSDHADMTLPGRAGDILPAIDARLRQVLEPGSSR